MSDMTDHFDDEIVIGPKGITVGGVELPGCISNELTVRPEPGGIDLWWVNLTLITGTPPRFEGATLNPETGVVTPDRPTDG